MQVRGVFQLALGMGTLLFTGAGGEVVEIERLTGIA